MKQTKTTLKELTAAYRAVLRHGILCNAIALGLIAAVPAPAMADDPITDKPVFVFGDAVWDNQQVSTGAAAFGGRRMDNWSGGKYQNDFPKYQMIGSSFTLSNSDAYFGPINLTLKELTDETFKFNYQVNEVDTDLAANAGVVWNDDYNTVKTKVAAIIGDDNAEYTAGPVYVMAQRGDGSNAGNLSLSNTTAVVDGSTINANAISVTDGSVLTFAKQDNSKLGAFNGGNIDSDGKTTLNAGTINIDGSRMVVKNGAELTINPTTSATFANNSATDGGAVYNAGTLTVSDATFNNNSATGNSGAIAGAAGSTLTLNNVAFSNNSADWGGAMVARGTTNITGGSFTENSSNDGGGAIYLATLINKGHKLNINGTEFTGNSTAGVDLDGGGAIGSFSDLTLKNATFTGNHVDGTASNGGGALFLGSVSTNDIDNTTFTSNTSATNGGAISMRFVDQGNNVDATLDITNSTFTSNRAADGKGGAIYNTFHNDKSDNGYASVSGSTFASNEATSGGAIYNEAAGTTDTVGGVLKLTDSTFTGNSATERGGALFNYGELTIDGVVFTSNSTTSESYPSQGGAIYNAGDVDYLDNYGVLTISNTTFGDANDSTKGNIAMQGGAISNDSNNSYNAELTLNNTNFYYNKAQSDAGSGYSALGGAIHNLSNADMTINGNTTFKGNSAEGYSAEGGAIYNSNWEKLTFNDAVTFDSNTVKDTKGDNGGFGGAISHHSGEMIFKDAAIFTNNKSISVDIGGEQPSGGAIYNNDGTITFEKGATFTDNEAMYGGAVFNYDGTVTINDGTFTDNKAGDEGGAIFNLYGATNINAVNNDVVFSGNKGAYGTSGEYANDITNYGGTINLNAASGKTITLAGGIDGAAGTTNITGAGTVETSTIKNQTVALNAGELHLTNADLTGSTVNVASGAIINTIDNVIQDLSANITLADGAEIMGDVDLSAGTADKYAAANGTSVKYRVGNLVNDTTGTSDVQVASDGVTVDIDEAKFTSDTGAIFMKTGLADGKIRVTAGSGGIADAATATETVSFVDYSLTADESLDIDKEIKSNFVLNGDGTESTDKGLTLNADLGVANGADLTLNEVKLAGDGELRNAAGATLRINDSKIGVNIRNFGLLYSDPTTFSGVVDNAAGATSNFDNDTFDATAELANAGTANLKNNVTFETGAQITGTGTVNMLSGTTAFNNTANTNYVTMANGASFSGTLIGGSLDTRNNNIDTGLGTVQNANLYVDANLKGTATIDSFAGTTGSTIKAINLTSSEYGTADSITLAVGDATLSDDLQITGAMNYYTKVEKDGTNLVFSDKLVNASGMKANARLADYDNTTSGLTAATLQGAIDENAAAIANIATTATTAWNHAEAWMNTALGIDSTTHDADEALQAALTSNDVIGTADNFADALSALDAQTYANKNNIGTLTGLNTTDQSNLVAAINEVVGDITVGTDGNYISAGADVAGNLAALDTNLKTAADKNGVQDTGLGNLAARLGVTYTAADGSVSATDYASNNYVTDGDSVVTAVGKLDTAIATAATTVTNAYNQAHAWAEGLLGVDVDEGTNNQLQNALTGLGGTTTIAGTTTTITGALKDLDTGIENLTTNTATGAINVASANIGAGGLTVAGDTALTGDLAVGGATTLTGLLTANGGISTTDITASGDVSVGGDLAVTGATTLTGALNGSTATFSGALSADSVAATNGVSAKTLSATDSITLGSNTVTSIDTAGLARGVAGNTGVLATTASVTTTIANQAQDATYTNTITTGSNVTGATLNAAIANLDATIGNMGGLSVRDDANSVGNALANGGTTAPTTVVAALNNIDATLGTVHNLSGKLTSAGTYKGNLAGGTTTTVEDHLVAVDTSIGDRSSLASLNTAINNAAKTDVATALETTGNLIGNMTFDGSNYLASVTDLSEAVRVLDSNIAKVDHKVEKLEKKVNSGMASVAALTALVPNARDCGDTQISIGTGAYADRAGVAVGAFHYFNDHVLLNVGASYGGTSDMAFRAGITFGL